MSRIKAVLFDVGGTLVGYGDPSIEEQLNRGARGTYDHLASRGYDLGAFESFRGRLRRALAAKYAAAKLKRREMEVESVTFGVVRRIVPHISMDAFRAVTREGFLETVKDVPLMTGARDALSWCAQRRLAMGIVSNTVLPGWLFREDLGRLGIAECFSVMVFSSEYGRPKPHKGIFAHALEGIGVAASDAVFVGDNYKADVQGACGAGLAAIWVKSGDDERSGAFEADAVIRGLEELPDALERLDA